MSRSPWSTLRTARGLGNLALTATAASASAAVGALATTPESGWYADLEKPSWRPPPIAFPLVWTPLYADIAVASAAVLTTSTAPCTMSLRHTPPGARARPR